MKVLAGTSGYSYKEWKGRFYPEEIEASEMLGYYASRLPTVEINNTFYRMPTEKLLRSWADQVPQSFRFVLKASRRITHQKKLENAGDDVEYLVRTTEVLGERMGMLLFQLPPFLRKGADRLAAFLDVLPDGTRAAFEFRHASWYDDEIFDLLRASECALCIAEAGGEADAPCVATAPYGYLRLRRTDYTEDDLAEWSERVRSQEWGEAFVFFKHEDEAAGPEFAERFLTLIER